MLLLVLVSGIGTSSARADFLVGSTPGAQFLGVTPVPLVLHYDNSGNFLGVFVAPGNSVDTPRGLAFGPDGNLYVSSAGSNSVLRYDGTAGTFIDAFVPAESGGLTSPEALIFQNDGFLYVSNFGTDPTSTGNVLDGQVTRYNAATGQFDSAFAQSSDIRGNCDGMAFGPAAIP